MPTLNMLLTIQKGLDPALTEMTNIGRRHILNITMLLLLKHQQEYPDDELWGKEQEFPQPRDINTNKPIEPPSIP